MYTISYIDRTNVSLALDPAHSKMMSELKMDEHMKGQAAGIFFFGYLLLQIPGGYLASRWSAKKLTAILLVFWGACAVGCGFSRTFRQFEIMRFLLGVAESGVYPATLVLLTHWFPRSERARANALWQLCMPLSVVVSAPITGSLMTAMGWHKMIAIEGALPFIWLPIWLYFISDHPRDAHWISPEEREHLETTLARESQITNQISNDSVWRAFLRPVIPLLFVIYFLQNCAVYGCMTFLSDGFKGAGKTSGFMFGVLFAIPYVVTAVAMVLVSWASDKSGSRRGYVALVYTVSGLSLIGSVLVKDHNFWLSFALLCLAIPGPFAALAPFWAIPAEIMPRSVMGPVIGLVNAVGNLGGFFGPDIAGLIKDKTGDIKIPFSLLGGGLVVAALLVFLIPAAPRTRPVEVLPV
jgi:MFS family permease